MLMQCHMLSVTSCTLQDVWTFIHERSNSPYELSELVERTISEAAAVGERRDASPGVQRRHLLDIAAEAPGPAGDLEELPNNVSPSCSHGVAVPNGRRTPPGLAGCLI